MEADLYLTQHPDATPRLNAALVEVQKMLEPVKKAAVNPFFTTATKKAAYAELCDVLEAIVPALNAHGIALTQFAKNDENGVGCITQLRHVSGEMAESTFWLPATKKDPQGYGSAFTYARRFGAKAAVGLAEEDDDGNSHRIDPKAKTAADYTKPKAEKPKEIAHDKILEAFKGFGITRDAIEARIGHDVRVADEKDAAALRAWLKELKALASETADQMAKRLEQEKAENGIRLEAETKKAKEAADAIIAARKAVDAQMTKLDGPPKPADAFSGFIDRIRAATTPGACALIVAEGAGAKLTAGDLKALQRASQDRVFVLNEKARTQPPQTGADLPF